MDQPQVLIGLYSPTPQCGKSTIARYLWLKGCKPVSFANPLRNMLLSFLRDVGVGFDQAYDYLYQDKETVIPELGVTARQLMRTLGTEWGRACVHPDVWVTAAEVAIKKFAQIVIDDVRFPNEAALIKKHGGELWLVTSQREGFIAPDAAHASDGALQEVCFDRLIQNNYTIGHLHKQVDHAYRSYVKGCVPC